MTNIVVQPEVIKALADCIVDIIQNKIDWGSIDWQAVAEKAVDRPQGEWFTDKNPDKDGDYLCISGIGTVYFRRIAHFTHDLYQIDHYAFHKYRYKNKTERSGWYDIDSDFGYFEVTVHAWCELPEMPEEFRRREKE